MAYNIHIVLLIDLLGDWVRWTLGYPLSMAFITTAVTFTGAWTGDQAKRLKVVAVFGLLSAIATLFWLILRGGDGVAQIVPVVQIFQAIATAYALWRLIVFMRGAHRSQYWEIALFLAAITVFTVDL